MGYSLFGRFVDVKNKKVVLEGYFDFMKNLSEMRYSSRFEGVSSSSKTSTEEFKDIFDSTAADFVSYAPASILDSEIFLDNSQRWRPAKENLYRNSTVPNVILDEDFYEENKDFINEFNASLGLRDMLSDFTSNGDVVLLRVKKRLEIEGTWYKKEDFEEVAEKVKAEFEAKKESVQKLKDMRTSPQYYEMSEEGKNSFLSDLGFEEDELEDLQFKVWAINKLMNLFEFVKEDLCFEEKDSDGIRKLISSYDDNREVELFIEVY